MHTIDVGTPINLTDLLHSRLLIQGNSGSGKSGLARNIIEQTFGTIPFVMWDLEGEHYPLKELSGDIIILGGQHADIPLSMQLAPTLPKFILSHRLNIVVDLSDLKMSQRIHFTKIFFEALMDLPIKYWTPYLFFLEECQKLAGEQDKQESATAIKDLLSRGRKRGYCAIPITQRIGMLNKSVASECNNKFIGKTVLDIDMDRSAKELGFTKAEQRLSLRDLQPGHFFAYGSSIEPQHVHEVTVNMPKTKLVKYGGEFNYKPKKPTEKLKAMLAKMNELPAEREKELKTLKELEDENSKLRKEIVSFKNGKKDDTVDTGVIKLELQLEKQTILTYQAEQELDNERKLKDFWKGKVDRIKDSVKEIANEGYTFTLSAAKKITELPEKYSRKSEKNIPNTVKPHVPDGEYKLSRCALSILQFLATYPHKAFVPVQVAIGSGYSHTSSGFQNAVSELNVKGLISKSSGRMQVVRVSDLHKWTGTFEEKIFNIYTFRDKLGKCEGEIYLALINDPKRVFTKDEIADHTGYSSSSSGFQNAISRLNTLELIRKEGKGDNATIQLNPELLEV